MAVVDDPAVVLAGPEVGVALLLATAVDVIWSDPAEVAAISTCHVKPSAFTVGSTPMAPQAQ